MKVVLFRVHAGDPLSSIIQEVTRTDYTHAALLIDEAPGGGPPYTICEAYVPHVRIRQLLPTELPGIDVFEVEGMTPEKAAAGLAYCDAAVAAKEPYSIENLFRFNPFFRRLIGEAYDRTTHDPVICSQFAFDVLDRGCGIKILNAPSYELAPGYLAWSTLLRPGGPATIIKALK